MNEKIIEMQEELVKKVDVTELGVLDDVTKKTVFIGDAEVEITPRIPFEEVVLMMDWALGFALDDRPFVNPALREVFYRLAIIKFYTNIDLTMIEKDDFKVNDLYELYDLLDQHKVIPSIINELDVDQVRYFGSNFNETLDNIVKYRNSAAGIIEQISKDAGKDFENLDKLMESIQEPETSKMIQDLIKITHEN